MSITNAAFTLTYEISPIILTGGAAANIPGGMLPIVSLTEAVNFVTGLLSGGDPLDLNDFFAHFIPVPGSTLIDQRIGQYPFANQAVAANAVITSPLKISMRMVCPAKGAGGYFSKLAVMTSLQNTIAQHNVSGGTYTIATPSYIYTNCIMTGLRDVSANPSAQVQTEWQWDFEQPLVTLQQAAQAQNTMMSKITAATQVLAGPTGAVNWSNLANTVAQPFSLAASSVVGAAQSLGGAGAAGPVSSLVSGLL